MRNEGKRNIEEINNRKHNRDCWKFTWEIMRIVGLEASLSSVPVPSPDKWGGLVAGRTSDHKTFARTNMASEDWPETSTPHKVGKDVEEEEEEEES